MTLLLYRPYSLISTNNSTITRHKCISTILWNFHRIYHHQGHRTLCGSMDYSYISSALDCLYYYFFIVTDDKDDIKGFSLFIPNDEHMYIELLCSIGYGSLLLSEINTMTKMMYSNPIIRLTSLHSSIGFYLKQGYSFTAGKYYVKCVNTNKETLKFLTSIEVLYYTTNDNFKLYTYDDKFQWLREQEYIMELRLN
jgi:hypothetical protein